jgi:hypothetical protein
MDDLLIEVFCDVDDFIKKFINHLTKLRISDGIHNTNNADLCSSTNLTISEIITIIIYFHLSGYRNFKKYYKKHICGTLRGWFPSIVSYNRFVELMKGTIIPLVLYTQKARMGNPTGISFIDSTTLDVCDNKRIHGHKVFKDIAQRGKSSTGWFYGFKLHLVINDCGEILSFYITPGDTDDRDSNVMNHVTSGLFGKLFGDKGYISQKLFEKLYSKGVQLITKLKKNMKNKLMPYEDKLLLRKRAIIESVNDFLKNICQIEHSRHGSFWNFLVNVVSGIAAYSFLPKKPGLYIERTGLALI